MHPRAKLKHVCGWETRPGDLIVDSLKNPAAKSICYTSSNVDLDLSKTQSLQHCSALLCIQVSIRQIHICKEMHQLLQLSYTCKPRAKNNPHTFVRISEQNANMGQIISYDDTVSPVQDSYPPAELAHYFTKLENIFLVKTFKKSNGFCHFSPLQKYFPKQIRKKNNNL